MAFEDPRMNSQSQQIKNLELCHHLKKLAIPLHCLLLDRGFAPLEPSCFWNVRRCRPSSPVVFAGRRVAPGPCVRGARATATNPAYRFLLMTLGLILANIWTYLRWWYTQRPRSGGRWLEVKEFQLNRFAEFILHALQHHYGYVREIKAVVAPT